MNLANTAPAANARNNWLSWHWWWAKVFGRQMPTSGDRVHIDNLVIAYRPGTDWTGFEERWSTDARRVYRIGDLCVFDYGDTPFEIFAPSVQMPARDLGNHDDLLAWNKREYGDEKGRKVLP